MAQPQHRHITVPGPEAGGAQGPSGTPALLTLAGYRGAGPFFGGED